MGRILGIDYGKARIGLALSDEGKFLASPLKVLKPGKTLVETAKLILAECHHVETIILGYPLKMNGEKSPMSEEVDRLKKELESHGSIPIILRDERLSSAEVEKLMMHEGVKRKKRAEKVDVMAACTILQNYLDQRGMGRL